MTKDSVHGKYDHWSMVVLYDSQTGTIGHTHQVVTTNSGNHPDREALEMEAIEQASQAAGAPNSSLSCIHVDPREIDFDRNYRVDLQNKTLVPLEQLSSGA